MLFWYYREKINRLFWNIVLKSSEKKNHVSVSDFFVSYNNMEWM